MSHAQHDWRTYLHRLPEAEPPAALWSRIESARLQSRPARGPRRPWLAVSGLAAAVALAALLVARAPVTAPEAPAPVAAVPAVAVDNPALRALDDAIGLAYARNAGQDELDALWQTRERLLGSAAGAEPLLARL